VVDLLQGVILRTLRVFDESGRTAAFDLPAAA
jgi:hypothetical protein